MQAGRSEEPEGIFPGEKVLFWPNAGLGGVIDKEGQDGIIR